MEVVVDVPDTFLIETSPEALGHRVRLYAALMMYQAGELSAGAACELAGVDRYAFLNECRRLGVAVLQTSAHELKVDLDLLEGLRGAGSR